MDLALRLTRDAGNRSIGITLMRAPSAAAA